MHVVFIDDTGPEALAIGHLVSYFGGCARSCGKSDAQSRASILTLLHYIKVRSFIQNGRQPVYVQDVLATFQLHARRTSRRTIGTTFARMS